MSEQDKTTEATDAQDAAAAVEETDETSEDGEQDEKIPYELGGIEDLEGSVKRVTFKVKWEDYEKKSLSYFEELQENADIEGFRKGKAPLRLVRARYGRKVKSETLETIAANCLQQIVEANDFTVFNRFDNEMPEVEEGKELEYTASLEIKPFVEAKGYDKFEVEVEDTPVTDEIIERQIEQIREANAILEDKGDKPIEENDAIVVNTNVTDENDEPLKSLTWENHEFERLTHLPKEITSALVGKKKDDTVKVSTAHTHDDHTHKQNWEIKILEVKGRTLPKLDDEFARDVGAFDNLDDLKKKIRADLEKQRENRERTLAIEQINDILIEQNPFEVPKSMINLATYDFAQRDIKRMQHYGLSLEALGDTKEEYLKRVQANAEKYLRIDILQESICKQEGIEISEDDINNELQKMADEAGRKPLAIRAQLEAQDQWEGFRENLRLQKVGDLLLGRANIKRVKKDKDKKE